MGNNKNKIILVGGGEHAGLIAAKLLLTNPSQQIVQIPIIDDAEKFMNGKGNNFLKDEPKIIRQIRKLGDELGTIYDGKTKRRNKRKQNRKKK